MFIRNQPGQTIRFWFVPYNAFKMCDEFEAQILSFKDTYKERIFIIMMDNMLLYISSQTDEIT